MDGATVSGEKNFWSLSTNQGKLITFSPATHSHLEKEKGEEEEDAAFLENVLDKAVKINYIKS